MKHASNDVHMLLMFLKPFHLYNANLQDGLMKGDAFHVYG